VTEPEVVNGNHATGNGHPEAIGIGPSVKPVLGKDHQTNGNGHHGKAPAPQQSPFSWAEFLAEPPAKPTGLPLQCSGPGAVPVLEDVGTEAGTGRRVTLAVLTIFRRDI